MIKQGITQVGNLTLNISVSQPVVVDTSTIVIVFEKEHFPTEMFDSTASLLNVSSISQHPTSSVPEVMTITSQSSTSRHSLPEHKSTTTLIKSNTSISTSSAIRTEVTTPVPDKGIFDFICVPSNTFEC